MPLNSVWFFSIYGFSYGELGLQKNICVSIESVLLFSKAETMLNSPPLSVSISGIISPKTKPLSIKCCLKDSMLRGIPLRDSESVSSYAFWACFVTYNLRMYGHVARLLLLQALQTNRDFNNKGQGFSVRVYPLEWDCEFFLTSRETVVGLLPIREAIALNVLPLDKHSWIYILSSKDICLFLVTLFISLRPPFLRLNATTKSFLG